MLNSKRLFSTIAMLLSALMVIPLVSFQGGIDKGNKAIDVNLLDASIKPQDDFFNYVNSKWIAANPIPATESRWGSFNILAENSKKMLRQIMQDDAKANAPQGSIAQKVGDFWYTGMDSNAVTKAGITPLKPYLNEIDAIKSKSDVLKVTAKIQKIGATPFFGVFVDADQKNSAQNILIVTQSGLGMPDRDYYTRTDEKSEGLRKAYLDYVKKLFTLSGSNAATAEASANTVMKIETQLANSSMTLVEQRDPYATYNKMTMMDLMTKDPAIDWKLYFAMMGLPPQNELIVAQPKFLEKVNTMIDETSIDDWKTYLRFHFLSNAANLVGGDFDQAHFDFYRKALTGVEKMDPRWKRVSDLANACMGQALGQEYVKRTFTPEAKQKMTDLIHNLQEAFSQRIDQLDWMSPETKAYAHKKLSAFTIKVGYPDKWKDYSALKIDRGPFVLNVFNCVEFETNRNLAKAGKPVDRGEWLMSPQTVNAYYNPTNNEIVFPAAILQAPFFDLNADNAVNYGGIGAAIGHEMTHGFDDAGSLYDADGNLKNWWTKEDSVRFSEKSKKVSHFYSMYTPIDTLHINGDLTNGENIADQGGLAIAFTAFLIEQKKNPQPEKIDGLTANERFFISYGQIWRGNSRDNALRMQLLTNPHSPGKYRVLGTLSNMPEWYTTFNVKPGDKMYVKPEDQTRIW